MMVNAYPSDIDDARLQRQAPSPLPPLSHPRIDFIVIEETSILPPKLLDPRFPDSDLSRPLQQTPKLLCRARDAGGY